MRSRPRSSFGKGRQLPRNTPRGSVLPAIDRIGSDLARLGLLSLRTSVFAALTIFLVDVIADRLALPLAVAGVLDEVAHVATAIVVMTATTRRRTGLFVVGVLVAAWAIDIDHVPREVFGWDGLTAGAPRPYTHSLATPLITSVWALCGPRTGREFAVGLAFGLVTHFLRDAATGNGLALFWPLTKRPVEISYSVYVGSLVACLLRTRLVARRAHSHAAG